MSQRCTDIPALAIVGNSGGTNIGESLLRAAVQAGYAIKFFDSYRANFGPRILKSLSWHLRDCRPLLLSRFSAEVVRVCSQNRSDILIATGAAPLTKSTLHMLRAKSIVCVNYSSDDPFNPNHLARWHLRALPAYDFVFTTRHANIDDLRRLGCANVHWLPFGYDDMLFSPTNEVNSGPEYDVLFAGGADRDRVEFITKFLKSGISIGLVGDYWKSYRVTRSYALGHKPPDDLRRLTAAANINLCLVRRANRDGHVMRSFEIAAIGGCMLVEDTDEHRSIFGADGEAVVYFRTPDEAAARAKSLLANPTERCRLKASVHSRITSGAHTYRDRLATMLQAAATQRT